MDNCLLTFIIPTYNRCKALDENLQQLYEDSKYYHFNIIVCNNASTDDTLSVISKWKNQFENFQVINQAENLLYARNVTSGYLSVKTDYCMVLGDTYTLDVINIGKIYDLLIKQRPTAVIVNILDVVKDNSKYYEDVNDLIVELGWYTTLLSSCVISREFIKKETLLRYRDTRFLHMGIFFDYLALQDHIKVFFDNNIKLSQIRILKKGGKEGWRSTPFKVFAEGWFYFVASLPNTIKWENKMKCIKSHDIKKNFFHPFYMLLFKLSGEISFNDYKECRYIVKHVTRHNIFYYDIINLIPSMPWLFNIVKPAVKKLFGTKRPFLK